MFDEYKDLLAITDVQSALGIGRSMAYRLIKDDKIRHLRIGKTIKVPKRYLVDFVENSCYTDAVTASLPSEGGQLLHDGNLTRKEQPLSRHSVLDAGW